MSATYNDKPLAKYVKRRKMIAENLGIPYIDLYSLWQDPYIEGSYNFGQRDWLCSEKVSFDSCHFSPKSSYINGEFIFNKFLKCLSNLKDRIMWKGKKKAITFSFDDGITQDIKLIELHDINNLKCTFNVNSGLVNKKK